jgi:hypothetical protein
MARNGFASISLVLFMILASLGTISAQGEIVLMEYTIQLDEKTRNRLLTLNTATMSCELNLPA